VCGVQSDLHNLLGRVDYWCLSNGGDIAPAGFRKFGSGEYAITVLAWLHFCGNGTFISKMYCSHWEPPGVCERRWSVNLQEAISEENQTLGGHSS